MAILKITQKHHNRFNDPFPPAPSTIPFTQGSLFVNSKTLHSQEILPIGNDFQLSWSSDNGGYLSISHLSQPSRPIWSTIPGKAFVSAALADTEVAESRGSFLVKDRDVHLVCHHQTIDDIKVINPCDRHSEREVMNSPSGCLGSNQKSDIRDTHLPTLLITGRIFNTMKTSRKFRKLVMHSNMQLTATGPSASARYWVLFSQKTNGQVGFKVKTETPKIISRKQSSSTVSGIYRGFKKRLINRKGKFGWLWNVSRSRGFALVSSAEEELAKLKKPESAEFNRVWLTYATDDDERFYGFGEQFSHMNLKGKKIPIFVQEQGIGRGDQPITFAANLVSYRAGGDWSTTYAPSPFYMTSKMRSIYLEGYDYTIFDLTIPDRVQIQIHGNSVDGRILHGNSPCELIERFTETIGRQPEIPEWIISGAIVGMQGGTEAVRHIWDELRAYDLPISACWLQVDEKTNKRRNHFEEAKQLDILVKNKNGDPYMVPNTAFNVGMLDLTNPKTATWFKQILREMVDDGVRGWMADFGEGLPVDAILYSGEDPISAHNKYPELWAQINREFVEEWKNDNLEKAKEEGLVFFMRAGFRDSPRWGMLFWEGDQMVSWQMNDGIKSSVVGLLSSGISGFAFNHSDIGGYCTVNLPLIKYRRSEELLLRWMELNSFTTIFRTHEVSRTHLGE